MAAPNLHSLKPVKSGYRKTSYRRSQVAFKSKVRQLRRLFNQVLIQQKRNNFVQFPSVKALAGQFNVTAQEIYTALEQLRLKGFDYEIIASRENILVWPILQPSFK